MALSDTWHRAMVYFGLAEDRDPYAPETGSFEPEAELEGPANRAAQRHEAEMAAQPTECTS